MAGSGREDVCSEGEDVGFRDLNRGGCRDFLGCEGVFWFIGGYEGPRGSGREKNEGVSGWGIPGKKKQKLFIFFKIPTL